MTRRRLALLGLILAAGLFGLWAFAGRSAGGVEDDWAEVTHEDLVTGVEVAGTLSAVESAALGPPQVEEMWNFKIAFMAPEGTEVRQGQPVLGFDSSELENKLQE
ncbi:MAG: hypothetical protein ABUL63_06060, partial [Acidobacteriota bacterium]